ncbi:MAG TPA: TIR domain-containing protein [Caulobacteraceae bacterium]
MADLFVSYARADRERVAPLVTALEAEGWSVWWDPEISAGQEFDRLISEQLESARAVVVAWTPTSVVSRWVRGEARVAADRGILAPVRFENAQLPIDLRAIHTTDLDGWSKDGDDPSFRDLVRAIRSLLNETDAVSTTAAADAEQAKLSICVLPFINISDDPQQEYFSDGISEDIITDLSKISALFVIARNTAFTYKGKPISAPQLARQLGVSHVLEGSVRKAGNRVRITAQLIDGATGGHIWAERWDRDLTDIFALQDEIAGAIVAALKLRLAPAEKKAIAHRSTDNPEAYKLYLMARRYWLTGWASRREVMIRLCQRAIDLDPAYARAWALKALCQGDSRFLTTGVGDLGWSAAERALELDPDLAEAHAAKGRILTGQGHYDEAEAEIEIALRLDPESYETNGAAARWAIATKRYPEALRYLQAAAEIDPSDYWAPGMATQCLSALGDDTGALAAARETVARVETVLATEPDNGGALGHGVSALILLGETERAMAWAEDALLLDPDNTNLRYNLACAMVLAGQTEVALKRLGEVLASAGREMVSWAQIDTDLDPLRGDPRYAEMLAAAEARLAEAEAAT